MNGVAGEKQEAEKRIREYTMSLSKKEEQNFKELVIHNEEKALTLQKRRQQPGPARWNL